MSEILIPIAISSQIADSGEERIHAANYSLTSTRPEYSAPVVIYYAAGTLSPTTPPGENIFTSTGISGPWSEVVTSISSYTNASTGLQNVDGVLLGIKYGGSYLLKSVAPYTTWSENYHALLNGMITSHSRAGRIVAGRYLGSSTRMVFSDDYGVTWTQVDAPGMVDGNNETLTWGDGYWAIAGRQGGVTTVLFSSDPSLTSWSTSAISGSINSAAVALRWTGIAWLAVNINGEVWRSTDRTTWVKTLAQGVIFDFTNGLYPSNMSVTADGSITLIAGGLTTAIGSLLAKSTDHGITWVDVSSSFPASTGNKISCIANVFYTGNHSSTDGETWVANQLATAPFVRFDGIVAI